MRLRPAGERGLLVEVESLELVHRLHAALLALDPPGVVELVPAYRTLLVVADPERAGALDELAARLLAAGYPVRWADPAEVAALRRFHTEDPFGNRLEFLAPVA